MLLKNDGMGHITRIYPDARAQDALSEPGWDDLLHLRNGFYRGSAGG